MEGTAFAVENQAYHFIGIGGWALVLSPEYFIRRGLGFRDLMFEKVN